MSEFIGKTYSSKEALEQDVQSYALKHGFAVTTLHLNGAKDSGYIKRITTGTTKFGPRARQKKGQPISFLNLIKRVK